MPEIALPTKVTQDEINNKITTVLEKGAIKEFDLINSTPFNYNGIYKGATLNPVVTITGEGWIDAAVVASISPDRGYVEIIVDGKSIFYNGNISANKAVGIVKTGESFGTTDARIFVNGDIVPLDSPLIDQSLPITSGVGVYMIYHPIKFNNSFQLKLQCVAGTGNPGMRYRISGGAYL